VLQVLLDLAADDVLEARVVVLDAQAHREDPRRRRAALP
jgi:hypothetical protein